MRRRAGYLLAASVLAVAGAAEAGETIAYRYDELGRLVRVSRSTPTSTATADYKYDSADNREKVVVTATGSPPPPPPPTPPPPAPPPGGAP
jgi:YD repeat-containing protein